MNDSSAASAHPALGHRKATPALILGAIGVMTLNVGSGVPTSVAEVANAIVAHFKADIPVLVTGAFRLGDIRHNFADISRIAGLVGFQPRWAFAHGLREFLSWTEKQGTEDAGFDRALAELKDRGLLQTGGR